MSVSTLKVLIWMNMPSHHQAAFFDELRQRKVELRVMYYQRVDKQRKQLGWSDPNELPDGEEYYNRAADDQQMLDMYREHIHIVPGYGAVFLRQLVSTLVRENIRWMHWSEPAKPGIRWWLSWIMKREYANKVNRYSSGALAIGEMAKRDFIRWGIHSDKIHIHNYSIKGLSEKKPRIGKANLGLNHNNLVFTFLGVLCHRKGTDVLIRSFRDHIATFGNSRLLLVGRNTKPERYASLIRKSGLESKTVLIDSVSANNVSDYLYVSDVLILPSRFDGWGMVLNEGASLSLPLISTDMTGSSYHLIDEGVNGYIVKAGSVSELRQAMDRYALNRALLKSHAVSSRQIFSNNTPSVITDNFIKLLTQVNQ